MNIRWRKRLNLSRWAIRYPRFTISFWVGVMVAGLLALSSLKYALFPDVTFPVVVIRASANMERVREMSDNLTLPLSRILSSMDSVESITSVTFPRETVITALFYAGESLEDATAIVNQGVGGVSLPDGAELSVLPYNLNESSVISYALTSDSLDLDEIADIADKLIIPKLNGIRGILKINGWGRIMDESLLTENSFSSLVNFNGESAIALQLVKRGDGNTLEIAKSAERIMEDLAPQLMDLRVNVAQTEATYIEEATSATVDSLWWAIVLAVLVIFLFLKNFSATLITALAIPLSLLGTFIIMAIAQFNLETITLLALALVMGIVVDDAIVEIENISRYISKGYTARQAAIKGSDEIGLTVSASTLTIVAVFLPVALMRGNVGQFFQPFGLTVSSAVIISLLVARTLTPVLALYWLKQSKNEKKLKERRREDFWTLNYRNLLIWSLSHRKIVMIGALVSFVVGLSLIPLIPQGFIPQLDRGEFNVVYTTELPTIPQDWNITNSSETENNDDNSPFAWLTTLRSNPNNFILRRTGRMGKKIEQSIMEIPEVETVFNTVGFRGQPNRGKIYVKLKSERNFNTFQVQDKVRENLPTLRGVNISVEGIKFVDTGDEKPFSFSLVSDNITTLYEDAERVKSRLLNVNGLQDLSLSPENIFVDEENVTVIEHLNGKPSVTFTANLGKGEALGDLTRRVSQIIQPLLSANVTLYLGGDSARMREVLSQFAVSFSISVVLMLLVLWFLFGSFVEPMAVAFSLPLSIVGAMLALLITQSDFGMISLMGVIFLLGLLDKNTLLLVDYTKQLREKGMNRHEAVILGGVTRLRPILMTTFSTILAMLPLALGFGAGAELRQPMAVAIIGGLVTSSLLSLIVVPVFYTVMEDIWNKFALFSFFRQGNIKEKS